jgi:hypothetical protein
MSLHTVSSKPPFQNDPGLYQPLQKFILRHAKQRHLVYVLIDLELGMGLQPFMNGRLFFCRLPRGDRGRSSR